MFVRQRAVVRADEGDAPARGGAGDDVEQRDAGRVEAEDGVVAPRSRRTGTNTAASGRSAMARSISAICSGTLSGFSGT